MEPGSLLVILRRRWRAVATTATTTLVIAGLGSLLMKPVYVASTTLRVNTTSNRSLDSVSYDSIMYATRLLNTYSKIATIDQMREQLRQRLGSAMAPHVKVDVPANPELMQISVEHEDPAVSAVAANTLAEMLVANVNQMEASAARGTRELLEEQLALLQVELQQGAGAPQTTATDTTAATGTRQALDLQQERYARLLDQYVRARLAEAVRADSMSVLEPAKPPETPARPRMILNMAVALALGLIGGVGMAFLLERFDTRLYTTRHIENVVDLSILTAIPTASVSPNNPLFRPASPEEEALRRVCTEFFHPRHIAVPRTVLVTSALAGEGKSTLVANLAVLVAGTGRTVVVVDCDLRRPAQHQIFRLPNNLGLSGYIDGACTLDSVLLRSHIPGLHVITSGPLPRTPAEFVGSWELVALLDELLGRYHFVLLDSPSCLAVVDAQALAPRVDRVVLVVARGRASSEAIWSAREQLISARAKSIGVVVNRADPYDSTYAPYSRASMRT